jgi:hypothetical protein
MGQATDRRAPPYIISRSQPLTRALRLAHAVGMALFAFKAASLSWSQPFMTAEWSMRTDAEGVYVLERLVGIGSRQRGPMSAPEADRFVANRRDFIGKLQRSIAG